MSVGKIQQVIARIERAGVIELADVGDLRAARGTNFHPDEQALLTGVLRKAERGALRADQQTIDALTRRASDFATSTGDRFKENFINAVTLPFFAGLRASAAVGGLDFGVACGVITLVGTPVMAPFSALYAAFKSLRD